MRMFFARHGESEANLLRVMSNRDVPHHLTSTGREQAKALAEALSGTEFAHIYCSPICRARETAEIVSRELGVALTVADGLREFDCGELEGRGDEEAWAQHLAVQKQWTEQGNKAARIEGGESFLDIEFRFRAALGEAERAYGAQENPVLFVSHGATLGAMLPLLLDNLSQERLWEMGLTYATYIEAGREENRLVCLNWNGQPFLAEAT